MTGQDSEAIMGEIFEPSELQELKFVNKKYVHKNKDENVHLYNLRRFIPRFINKQVFEKDLKNFLEIDEIDFLKKYYRKMPCDVTGDYKYVLMSIPAVLTVSEIEVILGKCNDKDKEFIRQYYTAKDNQRYHLDPEISEIDEVHLASTLKMRTKCITDSERAILSSMLEKVDTFVKKDVYYANMFIDPEHNYFFEHSLDHVPGIMIIETARQLIVSCSHLFGKVPTSGIDIILSQMEVKFKEYLWMSYPIRIKVEMNSIENCDEGYWKSCAGSIIFFQEHTEKARINIAGAGMKRTLLDAIMSKKEMKRAAKRNPVSNFNHEIYLKDENNSIGYFGTVVDISMKHIIVEFRIPILFSKGDIFSFNIHFARKFSAHGRCGFEWQRENDQLSVVRFNIQNLDARNKEEIAEIIKQLNFLREKNILF